MIKRLDEKILDAVFQPLADWYVGWSGRTAS